LEKFRVAVTGGSGRIGSKVVRALWQRGHDVINIDRRVPRETTARFCYADLRQRAQLQPLLEQVDALCHLAEIPNVSAHYAPEELFIHNTTVGAVVLQTAADLKLKRVIYTSTCQVYGVWGHPAVAPRQLPLTEEHPLLPTNVYSCAKVANEFLARMISNSTGLSLAIFRFPQVTSFAIEHPGDEWKHWFDGRAEFGDGFGTHLQIEDAARAYVLALEKPRPGPEAYHFTAAEAICTVPMRDLIQQRFPDSPGLPADWPKSRSPVDCEKAKDHFGWSPELNIMDAFRKKFGRDPLPPGQPK
jgi:UDP-glucose 4-epimerase